MPVGRDEFQAMLHRRCGDPDVVGGDWRSLFAQIGEYRCVALCGASRRIKGYFAFPIAFRRSSAGHPALCRTQPRLLSPRALLDGQDRDTRLAFSFPAEPTPFPIQAATSDSASSLTRYLAYGSFKLRQRLFSGLPDGLCINSKILMDQQIAHRLHLIPGDGLIGTFHILGHV